MSVVTHMQMLILFHLLNPHVDGHVTCTKDLAVLPANHSLRVERDLLMFTSLYSKDGMEKFILSVSTSMMSWMMSWTAVVVVMDVDTSGLVGSFCTCLIPDL